MAVLTVVILTVATLTVAPRTVLPPAAQRVVPGGRCHQNDIVREFRLFYPRYRRCDTGWHTSCLRRYLPAVYVASVASPLGLAAGRSAARGVRVARHRHCSAAL